MGSGEPKAKNFCFADFEFDPKSLELRKGATRIHLEVQPAQVLCILLERHGEVVTREELKGHLWPGDTFVDFDNGVNQTISKIRRVLNDSATHPRFVETLPRRGYRFIGQVEQPYKERSKVDRGSSDRGQIKRYSPTAFSAAGVAVLCLFGLVWWAASSTGSAEPPIPVYKLAQITRDTGYSGEPALSPHGRLLAYASDRGDKGNLNIWVQQLKGGKPIQITTDGAEDEAPSFSPDGNRIVFRSSRDGGGIYVVRALGGNPRRLAHGLGAPQFSPDGNWVSYFTRELSPTNQVFRKVWVVPASGGTARQVKTGMAWASPQTWSPDGKHLLLIGTKEPFEFGRLPQVDWWLVPLEGGEAVPLGVREPFMAAGLSLEEFVFPRPRTWLDREDWVIFDAHTEGGTPNLWRIRVPPKERRLLSKPQKLTAGVGETGASASHDGRIAFAHVKENWDIWSLPVSANDAEVRGEPERIVSGLGTDLFPSISTDGRRLVYTSDRAGNNDIWLRDLETNTDTPLTVSPDSELRGRISPDATKVAFVRKERGKTNIYLSELHRDTERLLLEDVGGYMDWTPDGESILFYTNSPLRWKTLDVHTGQQNDLELQHTQYPVHSVRFSPDQRWLSFKLRNPESPVFISKLNEGVAKDQDDWISISNPIGYGSGYTWWSLDGNTLYVLSRRDNFQCIWAQLLDPTTKEPRGPLKAVQHFHGRLRTIPGGASGMSSFGYGLTADKHYLPLSETEANIWLAEPETWP